MEGAAERGEQRSQKGVKGDSTASSDGSKTGVDSIDSLGLEIDARLSILRGTTLTNASRGLVHALALFFTEKIRTIFPTAIRDNNGSIESTISRDFSERQIN